MFSVLPVYSLLFISHSYLPPRHKGTKKIPLRDILFCLIGNLHTPVIPSTATGLYNCTYAFQLCSMRRLCPERWQQILRYLFVKNIPMNQPTGVNKPVYSLKMNCK